MVQPGVNTFQISQRHLLLENHLVEADDEVCIQEPSVEYAEPETAPDELEVVQVLWVYARCRVDLQRVVVMGGVLKQAIEWVKHLVREKEEEFSVLLSETLISQRQREERTHLDSPP